MHNNKTITDAINKLNERNKANYISTFDFTTLYTKLPHNKLLIVLHHLIEFCFDGDENKFIQINKFGARWIREFNNNRICLSKQQMKDDVSYLLSN